MKKVLSETGKNNHTTKDKKLGKIWFELYYVILIFSAILRSFVIIFINQKFSINNARIYETYDTSDTLSTVIFLEILQLFFMILTIFFQKHQSGYSILIINLFLSVIIPLLSNLFIYSYLTKLTYYNYSSYSLFAPLLGALLGTLFFSILFVIPNIIYFSKRKSWYLLLPASYEIKNKRSKSQLKNISDTEYDCFEKYTALLYNTLKNDFSDKQALFSCKVFLYSLLNTANINTFKAPNVQPIIIYINNSTENIKRFPGHIENYKEIIDSGNFRFSDEKKYEMVEKLTVVFFDILNISADPNQFKTTYELALEFYNKIYEL